MSALWLLTCTLAWEMYEMSCDGISEPQVTMSVSLHRRTGMYGAFTFNDEAIRIQYGQRPWIMRVAIVHEMTHYLQYKVTGELPYTDTQVCKYEKTAFDLGNELAERENHSRIKRWSRNYDVCGEGDE